MSDKEQLPLPLGLEWDQDIEDVALTQVEDDDDFLAGVSACGMSPEECEACQ